jgi:hypothetical protein
MKTFLKVLLIAVLAILAVKLLPITLAFGCLLAAGVAFIAGIGVATMAVAACLALLVVTLLSPLWIPILAIIGVVMLVKRYTTRATV